MQFHQIRTTFTAFAITLAATSLAAQTATDARHDEPNLVQVASKAGQFETLLTAAKAAGLATTLAEDGPFTVFAPTDDAFAKLPEGTIPALLEDKAKLAAILTYHVVPGRVTAADLAGVSFAGTVQGQALRVQASSDKVMVDGARVVKADIAASNGIIHVIDTVVLPRADLVDTAVEAGSFRTLVTAVKAADLVETLKGKGPFTVFAPTDDAFAALPEGTIPALLKDKKKLSSILTYHVVEGRVLAGDLPMAEDGAVSATPTTVQGQKLAIVRNQDGVTINGARVVTSDIVTGNGVIHVIDKVILPK